MTTIHPCAIEGQNYPHPGYSVLAEVSPTIRHQWRGLVRKARATADPDTFFSIPAQVSIGGRTIRGYITSNEDDAGTSIYQFVPYRRELPPSTLED